MTILSTKLKEIAPKSGAIIPGTLEVDGGAEIRVSDDGSDFIPLQVFIDNYYFDQRGLRQAAKLFNRLADNLDSQGRCR